MVMHDFSSILNQSPHGTEAYFCKSIIFRSRLTSLIRILKNLHPTYFNAKIRLQISDSMHEIRTALTDHQTTI